MSVGRAAEGRVAAIHEDTAVVQDGDLYRATITGGWSVWGPNGGYLASIALRAAGAEAPSDHRPATISVQYVAGAEPGPATCVVTPVKQGRNAWLLNVVLGQAGRTVLQAQVWTTNRADGPVSLDAAKPDVPPPQSLKSFDDLTPADVPIVYPFWMNFEGRPVAWRGWDAPRIAGPPLVREWYRYRNYAPSDAFLEGCRALILLDTFVWIAHQRSLAEPPNYIAPSLDLTVWFHASAPDADWLLVDAATDVTGAGLIHGRDRIWAADGRLIASGGSHMIHMPRR